MGEWMPDGQSDPRSRRMYDDILPVIMLKVEDRLRETRHSLRQEITTLATQVQAGQVQQSHEHEQVRADLADLKHAVSDLVPVAETVAQLRDRGIAEGAQDEANAALRRTVWKATGALIAVVGVANGIAALLIH